ncbi:hypothetical protein OV203_28380 [Nannocystis sp. ILAH1]|uniref:hypothetical protein n=1 Tax=Nannocystis sp. ILAH1 TaxID=2996789 RepID=UPI0022718B92|nr:hypothetical protein [Nannocystis sp. ILAH1]MCY0991095.1 hypothetical protein [Nannocystis sp. ILAH1]
MSIDFTILCTQSPERFLRKRTEWLKWNARRRSGSFGGMSLSWTDLEDTDPLPEPEWAERVVAVIRADGRLSDDTYDDFDSWTAALADATHGAVYSHPSGRFTHIWADADPKRTAARMRELLDAGDFAGLAAWIRELVAAQQRAVNAAGSQLHWIGEVAIPELERRVAAGDAASAPALVALHDVLGGRPDPGQIDALVLAAAALPELAGDTAVQRKAAALQERRLRAEAAAAPLPADLPALQRLLDDALGGDPAALARLDRFTGYELDDTAIRQKLVIELAKSGRELPISLSCRLIEHVYHVPELQSPAKRESFAAYGSLARQIAERLAEQERRTQENRRARTQDIAERTAEFDALYGRDRKRPRMPDDLLALIRRGQLTAALAAYRERFPALAAQAAQAIEDARAHFAPKTAPLG